MDAAYVSGLPVPIEPMVYAVVTIEPRPLRIEQREDLEVESEHDGMNLRAFLALTLLKWAIRLGRFTRIRMDRWTEVVSG